MPSYKVMLVGCKIGAIGITYGMTAEVKLKEWDLEKAKLALYERFDHITGVRRLK